ncbi:Organic cation transporter protein [Nymphon striatum]|nr:Organic cation transporter protein [Nymphon striatum]
MNVVLLQGPVNITSSRPIQDEEANLNHQRSKVEPLDISNVESSKKPKLPSSCNVQPAELGENADSTLKKTDTSVMPVLENCSEKHRAVHGSTIFWGFPIGMIVLAGISYGLKNWVYIQITIAVLFVVSLILTWAVNAFVYYGLSFNTNNLGGNPFINFFIAAAVEIPAYLLAALLVRYIGRKISLMMFMVIGGIACASPIVIPEEMTELSVAFPMIGKLCISGSFAIIYVYAAELFPTVARNIGVSSCSMVARIGSIGAPYVKELGIHTHRSTPFAVYAVLSISSGLLILLLPETKDASIPDSMEEAEQMTRCQRVKYLS